MARPKTTNGFAFPSGAGFAPTENCSVGPTSEALALPNRVEGCNNPDGVRKVPSMLFDLEMEDEEGIRSEDVSEAGALVSSVKALVEPLTYEEGELVKSVQELCSEADGKASTDPPALARHLQNRGYEVAIRKAVGGGDGKHCLQNLSHTFLRCILPGSRRAVIIDPTFRKQFEIMHPTQKYSDLLAEIPIPIAISEDRVPALVEILCKEMSHAFKEANIILPPWRKASSVLSKWKPRKSTDEPMRLGARNAAGHKRHGTDSAPTRPTLSFDEFCNSGSLVPASIGLQSMDPPSPF